MVIAIGFVGVAMAQEDDEQLMPGLKVKVGPANAQQPSPGLLAPVNDVCSGALVIPDGPYPVLSSITTDVMTATDDANDPAGDCGPYEHVIWYAWTPANTGFYKFQNCNPPTATTDADGVMAIFTSGGGCAGPFTQVPGGCNDDGCHGAGPSIINYIELTGGTTYYILMGVYGGQGGVINQFQVQIQAASAPTNDTCATAIPLVLDTPVNGGTLAAVNDYQAPTTCYTTGGQVGNTTTTAPGRDVVYSFTAPAADRYSFRVQHWCGGEDPTLYLLNTCGAPGPQGANCLRGANRGAGSLAAPNCPPGRDAEEVKCFTMTAGQTVYAVVDEVVAGAGSNTWDIEVNRCVNEVEFNGAPASASPLACPVEGSILSGGGLQDIDFFALGTNAADSRVFAFVDAAQANPGPATANFDMRITDATNTLEFDDLNNSSFFGANSPNIDGRKLPNAPAYIRITNASTSLAAEPYRLYSIVRGPGTEVPETEPNDGLEINPGDYFSGFVASAAADIDFYGICVKKGDEIMLNEDSDPLRDNTPFRAGLFLFGPNGFQIPPGVADAATTSSASDAPGAGLAATTPFSPGNSLVWRALVDGFYFYAVNAQASNAPPGGTGSTSGDYLVSASLNCAAPAADLSVVKTGPSGPVPVNSDVTYTININNAGPNNATCTTLTDVVPDKTTFVGLTAPDGWYCSTPPVGEAGTITCSNGLGICSGENDLCITDADCPAGETCGGCNYAPDCLSGSAEIQVTIHVPYCYEHDLANTASVSSFTHDPNTSNNSSSVSNTVDDPRTCEDGSECTIGDYCVGNDCIPGEGPNCDDGNPCTDDGCDPDTGCYHDANTAPCSDGDICTGAAGTGTDQCANSVCVPGGPNTNPCNDNNACTLNDTCANSVCVGGPPPNCNDGNNCTDDSCLPATGCVNVCNNSCEGNVKGYGWWKRLCRGPHPSGEFISMVDVDCVNDSCTFAGVSTIAQLCDRLNPDPQNDKCEQAEAQFMTLLLNNCRCRTGHHQPISATCGPDTTVGQAIAAADAALCNPSRTHQDCILSHQCDTFPINSGQALWANSLRLQRVSPTSVRITWSPPYTDGTVSAPTKYRIYTRTASELPFTLLAEVTGSTLSFQDNSATGGSYQYEIQAIW